MAVPSDLPRPRARCFLHCVKCDTPLFYVRPERGIEHHYECRRCGQWHAAWKTEWEPFRSVS